MKKMLVLLAAAGLGAPMAMGAPSYVIEDLGLVQSGDFASQGFGVSPGGVAFGRGFGSSNIPFFANPGQPLTALPNLAGKPYGVANGANDSGMVVGVGANTSFGSGAVPLQWTNGVVTELSTDGAGVGRANDVNDGGYVVGSIGGGSVEVGAYWHNGTVNPITATTAGGARMTTAFRVNNAGFAVGNGIDPNNVSRNVGLMYNIGNDSMVEVPALPGHNGTIAFDISEAGHVVGSSSFNQTDSKPFIWSADRGASEAIPLPDGTSSAIARGVNSDGWVVGIGSGQFAVPFLYDGEQTYRLQDLLPADTDWDISTNTSSSALGIAEDGTIVGTAVIDGEIRAYRMTLVPAPGATALLGLGGLAFMRRRR
ncbi:MAG: DUF3466 family protein [Phycisphaerales bacterium JB065]